MGENSNDTETLWHYGPDFDGFPIRMSDLETQWRPACCKRWYVYAVKNVCDCWNDDFNEAARDVIADARGAAPRCFHCKQTLQRLGDGFANCTCRTTALTNTERENG